MEEFVYEGYMSQEAQEFFKDNIEKEQRDGVSVVGSFIKLANGDTHLPNKGDIFTKHTNGTMTVKSIHRPSL
jgi:hypothetical protein